MGERSKFRAVVRYWRPEQPGGLAVIDLPAEVAGALGGLRQMRVRGVANGAEFTSNTMPAGGGRLAMSMSRELLASAGLAVGDEAEFEVERIEA